MAVEPMAAAAATGQHRARAQLSGTTAEATGAVLALLEAAPAAELRAIWRAEQGTPPPATFTARLLRLALAWDAQQVGQGAKAVGGALDRIARRRAAGAGPTEAVIGLKPPPASAGTRLMRVWGGQTHEVIVMDQGVLWRGRTWSSLSVVAGQITGNARNGPQFFGLRGKAKT